MRCEPVRGKRENVGPCSSTRKLNALATLHVWSFGFRCCSRTVSSQLSLHHKDTKIGRKEKRRRKLRLLEIKKGELQRRASSWCHECLFSRARFRFLYSSVEIPVSPRIPDDRVIANASTVTRSCCKSDSNKTEVLLCG